MPAASANCGCVHSRLSRSARHCIGNPMRICEATYASRYSFSLSCSASEDCVFTERGFSCFQILFAGQDQLQCGRRIVFLLVVCPSDQHDKFIICCEVTPDTMGYSVAFPSKLIESFQVLSRQTANIGINPLRLLHEVSQKTVKVSLADNSRKRPSPVVDHFPPSRRDVL